ncbi:MAG: DUF3343 domain-containing protein [Dethiobacteria bacterium]|jgi:hypothetical protein|nr:DUF3343 domain-containing protein [Bacillota bacterium]NMD33292.1 DUF3343 domain-containing protein [Bacillota bacterium]HOB29701.1 DUF3343 domain-containing protein [Bacillota bacterium]HPZ41938.1 DUF3343 domain-containing protein [Bacillota bacterium]HQD53196.1 DUF3343 domain-containing protein [Bacillota bacterium]
MNNYCYLTFPTTYFALRSEAVLQETPLDFKLVPVPRSISSSCGTALRCSCADLAVIKSTLEKSGIEIDASFELAENKRPHPVWRRGKIKS